MTVLSQFGIDAATLPDVGMLSIPDPVEGRVLQLDADILCYHATFDPHCTFEQACYNYEAEADKFMVLAGATSIKHHLTASGSSKGDRYELAIQQPYQANRGGTEKPPFLEQLRQWVRDELDGHYYMDIEADDGMCLAQQEMLDAGNRELSVIYSEDKDLRMMEGLHLCPEKLTLVDVKGYGSIWLKELTSQKKVLGWGTSFFWAQLLMGDTADDITGLKTLSTESLNKYKPTTASLAGFERLANPNGRPPTKAQREAMTRAPQPCGAVTTYDILKDCTNNQEAAAIVIELYQSTYGEEWLNILLSECKLLWMRRWSTHHDDVRKFIRGVQDGTF